MATTYHSDTLPIAIHYESTQRREITTILIAGGSGATFTEKERGYTEFIRLLTEKGIFVATFHYSDWDKKTKRYIFEGTCIEDRLSDLKQAFYSLTKYCPLHNIIVLGYSMGGPLVARFLSEQSAKQNVHITGSILIAPAAYSPQAWTAPFVEPFRKELAKGWGNTRDPNRWGKNPFPKMLVRFAGDTVIPERILKAYANSATRSNSVYIEETLPGDGHVLFNNDQMCSKRRSILAKRVLDFTEITEQHKNKS